MFKGEMRRVGPPKSLDEARRLIKGYVVYCNNVHLNGAIGYIAAFSSARRVGNPAAGGAAHAQMTILAGSLIRGRLPAGSVLSTRACSDRKHTDLTGRSATRRLPTDVEGQCQERIRLCHLRAL